MEQKVFFQNSKGNKLCGILFNPTGDKTKPIIILVHGHSSNKNTKSLVLLRSLLESKEISTFRIDLYGHGESEGKFEDTTVSEAVDDILQAIKFLKDKGYKKIGLVGSSFGGIASAIAASKINYLFVLCLRSPVSDWPDVFLWNKKSIIEWKKRGYIDYVDGTKKLRLKYVVYEDAIKNISYDIASKIKAPTLILHGDKDDEVPHYQSVKLSKLIPNCKLITIKGAGHGYVKPEHMKKTSEAIANFIFQQTKHE